MHGTLPAVPSNAVRVLRDAAGAVASDASSRIGTATKSAGEAVLSAGVDHLEHAPEGSLTAAVADQLFDRGETEVTAHDGFVAFRNNGRVVGGRQPGAVLRDSILPSDGPLKGLAGFFARHKVGKLTFNGPDGSVTRRTNKEGEGSYSLHRVSGVDPEHGGMLDVGITTPGGQGDHSHVLALPANYDGPVFVCDIDGTLRATSYVKVAQGKEQPPIAGTRKLLRKVARLGVPIVYLTTGSDKMHEINETFLGQMPPGILLDREQFGIAQLNPSNKTQAREQANFKDDVLIELAKTFPKAKLFGLGDDKYGDAVAYTRMGSETYIHDIKPGHANIPPDFHGVLTKTYTPAFAQEAVGDLKQAIATSASFGGTPVASNWMASLSRQLDLTTHSKLTTDNSFELYVDGEHALPHILAALDSAQSSICYETYDFWPHDPISSEVADHLIAAKKRGVKVRLNVDAFGARELPLHPPNPVVRKLEAAGIPVRSYNPINSLGDLIPNRNHRKDIVVDGTTAYLGGMNTAAEWMGGPNVPGRQHDLFAKIQGPAVLEVAKAFQRSWVASGHKAFKLSSLRGVKRHREELAPNSVAMRVMTHVPHNDKNIHAAYLALIDHAQTSINVENSFPIEKDVADALSVAAKRGVNVRYIVGSDEGLLGDANRTRFQAMLDAGVHIYIYPTKVHTKAMSVDGKVCTIGSSNFDAVALERNREIIALVQDPATTQSFDSQVFDRDVVGDPKGRKTLELPKKHNDPVWKRLADALLEAIWPDSIE